MPDDLSALDKRSDGATESQLMGAWRGPMVCAASDGSPEGLGPGLQALGCLETERRPLSAMTAEPPRALEEPELASLGGISALARAQPAMNKALRRALRTQPEPKIEAEMTTWLMETRTPVKAG